MANPPDLRFRLPLRKSFYLWTWLAVVLSISICVTLSWLRFEQSKALFAASHVLDDINLARIDFARGFLYVTLADDPQSPFRKVEGLALVDQAIARLQHAKADQNAQIFPDLAAQSWNEFEQKTAALRTDLANWSGTQGEERSRLGLRLHLEFRELEQYGSQVDLASHAALRRLNSHLDETFAWTIVASALLLGGICIGVYLVGRNLNAAVTALHDREMQLRVLGDNLPDGYIYRFKRLSNGQAAFSYISAGVQRVHGVSAADCLRDAACLMSLLDPEQAAVYAAAEAASAKNLTEFGMDLRFQHADGRPRIVRVQSKPMRAENDSTVWDGLVIDVTEHRLAEEAIRRQQRNYEEIFNATNDSIFLHDAATGRVLDVNDAALRMYGYETKAEMLADTAHNVIASEPPYDWSHAEQLIQKARTEGPQVFEWLARRQQGERFWAEVSLSSSHIDGQGRVLAIVRDISQRKAHELEIERLNRLYSTLSQVNQIIVRCQSREELFQEITRVLIEFGKMHAVWIGLKNATGALGSVAHRTQDAAASAQPLPDWEHNCGLVTEMLGTSCPALCNHTQADRRAARCCRALPQMGIQSCAAFPLRFHGQIAGAVSICSTERNFFNTEEVRLLEEIAGDISYALDRLDEQKQRQEAKLALQQSEEHFRVMFETAAIGMAQADLHTGQFRRVNRKMCAITGYSETELLNKNIRDITHPEDRDRDWNTFQRVVRGEVPHYHREKRYVRRDGSIVWVNVNMNVVRDDAGNPIRSLATIEDITERRLAETERIRLSTAMEQASESIVITDVQGQILYVNPAFEKLTGYARQEAIGQNPRLLKSGSHDDAFYTKLWQTVARGEVWQGHIINRKKDGTLFEEEATITPVRNPAGKVINYVAVKRDVTREIELEAQIRQVQKMEGIGQLAGGVAHDFNNILAAIMMQAQLTESTENLPASVVEDMQHIRQSCERGANLTRQLLLFSRKQVSQPRDLDLNDSVANISKMLRRVIGENISMQLNLSSKSVMAHADPGMLDQVLLNLAVNARDAMNHQGRVTIATTEELVDEATANRHPDARPGTYACLAVSDTGTGIAPEVLPRIFEPFFTTKEMGKGTGLGLATVFGIIKHHKGWIKVETELGKGTTFRIFLPSIARPLQSSAQKNRAALPRGTETILLAEDDFSVRAITRRFLETQGYTVVEAKNGVEALELWPQNRDRIQLLLTDLLMPEGVNGRDLARKIQADRPDLKVIYFSGYSADLAGQGLTLEPGKNFLKKPFTPSELLEMIRRNLDAR